MNVEDQPITRYHFEIPGIEDDELDNIRVVALKISDLYLIDYYKIFEVLSGDGETDTWTLQRILAGADYIPEIEVDKFRSYPLYEYNRRVVLRLFLL
ncbi:unnamed protein product [marine sediment metagenome]|uniref:Uncharacterized protein n=1 Tax=marine sediment metagenome TaxID=412755 RepID=X1SRK8_9ZZZZ